MSLYRILQIDSKDEIQTEGMGSKAKSWFLVPEENNSDWLFKRSQREGSGEHWAEKIAAEVAGLLGVPHARVELAEHQGNRGSITENIAPHNNWDLIHGNEVLESASLFQDDTNLNFHLSDHTLDNIWLALNRTFESDAARTEAKARFAEYLVLDAVVGNTDRHSENWGILQRQDASRIIESLAPSYDHGSSLGHELMEERRKRWLEQGVDVYVERGPGQIYWHQTDRRGPSPLELIRLAVSQYPEPFRTAIAKLDNLDESALQGIVNTVPGDWIEPSARTFALELMCYSFGQLKEAI